MKVLWLNNNQVSEDREALQALIEENYPHIEILNSEFTRNVKEWGIKFGHCYPKLHKVKKINLTVLCQIYDIYLQ